MATVRRSRHEEEREHLKSNSSKSGAGSEMDGEIYQETSPEGPADLDDSQVNAISPQITQEAPSHSVRSSAGK
jgi:hypothetical protein